MKNIRTTTVIGAFLAANLAWAAASSAAELPVGTIHATGIASGSLGSLENLPTLPAIPDTSTPEDIAGVRAAYEAQLKAGINDYRASKSMPRVTWAAALDNTARWWSDQHANHGKTGHSPWNTRPYAYGGENIGFGRDTSRDSAPDLVLQSWINSPGHQSNLLASGVARAGVGLAWDDTNKHWVATYQFETP